MSSALNESSRSLSRQFDVAHIVDDETLSDTVLYEHAQSIMTVLKKPEYSHLNIPHWVLRVEKVTHAKSAEFTIERFFSALYETANILELQAGRRFVSATIYACAVDVQSNEALTSAIDKDGTEAQLAVELSKLASSWIAYLLWPCKSES